METHQAVRFKIATLKRADTLKLLEPHNYIWPWNLYLKDMTSYFKKILDLTYPITSMFSGASFNSGIASIFKGKQIEVHVFRLFKVI